MYIRQSGEPSICVKFIIHLGLFPIQTPVFHIYSQGEQSSMPQRGETQLNHPARLH
jgi:hypothetical protein